MNGKRERGRGVRRRLDDHAGRTPGLAGLASLAAAARVDQDETVKNLLRAVHYTGDPGIAEDAAAYLGALALEQVLSPDFFGPPLTAEEARGELVVGTPRNAGCEFGFWRDELVQHTLVMGHSGSGKTTFITKVLKEVLSLER